MPEAIQEAIQEAIHEAIHEAICAAFRKHTVYWRLTRVERVSSRHSMSAPTEGGPIASQSFLETYTCWGRGEGAA